MKVLTALLYLWILQSFTEAQLTTRHRGGVFSFYPTRGDTVPYEFSMPPPRTKAPFRHRLHTSGASMGAGIGRNIPLTYIFGNNIPSNLNIESSVPLVFRSGRYVPINFSSVNGILTQNIPHRFNTVNTFHDSIRNNINTENKNHKLLNNRDSSLNTKSNFQTFFGTGSIDRNLNTERDVRNSGITETTRPVQLVPGRNNSSNFIVKNSMTPTDISQQERNQTNQLHNIIDFLDQTENRNVEPFSGFGFPRQPKPPSFPFDANNKELDVSLKSKLTKRNQFAVPNDSNHFGSTKLLAGTVSGTTDPTTLPKGDVTPDMSQFTAAEFGNFAVLRGSNNFQEADKNAGHSFRNVPPFLSSPSRSVPTTTKLPVPVRIETPHRSQTPFSAIPPQHPLNPTTAFDLMGNMAGPFHDPLMVFGLSKILDLDIMDNTLFKAISNPISVNAALQMRVQATPTINLMASSNVQTSPFLPTSSISPQNGILNFPLIRNNDIRAGPHQFQSPQNTNGRPTNGVLPPRTVEFHTQHSEHFSRHPFLVNSNPVRTNPPGVQFLSRTIPKRTENVFSRYLLQTHPLFDPIFGITF